MRGVGFIHSGDLNINEGASKAGLIKDTREVKVVDNGSGDP